MINHVSTMLTLRDAYLELDLVQDLVNIGRYSVETEESAMREKFHRELDRKQAEITRKREYIEEAMMTIAVLN